MKKTLSLILSLVMLYSSMSMAFGAADQPNDPLTFTRTGNGYIYSNNPEYIEYKHLLNNYTGAYTISQKLTKDKPYDAEYAHKNYSSNNLKIGVLICNTGTSTEYVTVYNNNYALSGSSYQSIGSSVETNYWNGVSNQQTGSIAIAPNSVKFINYTTFSHGSYAVGKVLFKPTGSNLYCKIVYVKAGSTDAQAQSVPQVTGNNYTQTTASYLTDTRAVNYNYQTASKKAFYLSLVNSATGSAVNNVNEYETPQYYLPGSNSTLMGNYGVNYFITFQYASGRTLRMTPDWLSAEASSLSYVLYYRDKNGDGIKDWETVTITETAPGSNIGYYDITIPSDQQIKYILPSASIGNVYFKFMN